MAKIPLFSHILWFFFLFFVEKPCFYCCILYVHAQKPINTRVLCFLLKYHFNHNFLLFFT